MAGFNAAIKKARKGAVWSGWAQALLRRRPLARRARRLRPMVWFARQAIGHQASGSWLYLPSSRVAMGLSRLAIDESIANTRRDSFRSQFQRSCQVISLLPSSRAAKNLS